MDAPVRVVAANGVNFAYFEAGEGDDLVLCMHGFPDTPHCWLPLLNVLADAGFRAVAPFMRGYSPTGVPDNGRFRMEDIGRDVLALIEALGHETAVVVGHDWGASAVYSAVMLDDSRISKLVGLAIPPGPVVVPSPKILWSIRHFMAFQFVDRAVRQYQRDPIGFLRHLYERWSPTWDVPDAALAPVVECFDTDNSARHAISYYREFGRGVNLQIQRKLTRARVTVPCLFLAGDEDIFEVKYWDRLGHGVERGVPYHFEVIKGTGHFLQHEAPDRVSDVIVTWLTQG